MLRDLPQAARQERRRRLLVLLCAVLLVTWAEPAAVSAQSEERLQIRGVDPSGYPEVVLDVQFAGPRVEHAGFVLREDGRVVRPLRVVFTEQTDRPVSVVLALDRSGSMAHDDALTQAKIAADSFVAEARPDDRIGLVVFDTVPTVLVPPTTDHHELRSAIAAVEVGDMTALWDAISLASELLAAEPHEDRYVVVISDIDAASYDNASLGGSGDAAAAAVAAGAAVMVVGLPLGEVDDRELREVTEASGGLLLYAPDPTRLEGLFREVQQSLRTSYQLSYTSMSEGPVVELALTVQSSRAAVSFEVPEPQEETVERAADGEGPGRDLPIIWLGLLGGLLVGAAVAALARRGR